MSNLEKNTAALQVILERVGSLIALPTLTNPGTAAQLREDYQLIDADGNLVEGSMGIGGFDTWVVWKSGTDGHLWLECSHHAGYLDGEGTTVIPLVGLTYVDADGNTKTVNLIHNGVTSGTIDGLNTTSVDVPEGYTEGGSVTFDDTALAARIDAI